MKSPKLKHTWMPRPYPTPTLALTLDPERQRHLYRRLPSLRRRPMRCIWTAKTSVLSMRQRGRQAPSRAGVLFS